MRVRDTVWCPLARHEENNVLRLRILLAAAAAALSVCALGPMLLGTTPAFADRPHPTSVSRIQMTTVINVNHQVRTHHINHIDHVRPVQVVQPVVVTPVSVVQPVIVAVPVVTSSPAVIVTSPYPWASNGPNWNAGWTLSQTRQLCQTLGQTLATIAAAYNQYVQAVCYGSSSAAPYQGRRAWAPGSVL
jgi:hypothetical protein